MAYFQHTDLALMIDSGPTDRVLDPFGIARARDLTQKQNPTSQQHHDQGVSTGSERGRVI